MITSEEEYATTLEWVAKFVASLDRLDVSPDTEPHRVQRIAAAAAQLGSLRRELAMWEAGIREPVPPSPDAPELSEGSHDRAGASVRLKRAEVANIDRQVGIALDRIADWRRHRAWLEREIDALEAPPAGADSSEAAPAELTPAAAMPVARAG